MANAGYRYGAAEVARGNVDLLNDNIKCAYVNISGGGTLYTFDADDQFLSDIPAAAIGGTSPNLTVSILDSSIIDVENFTFVSVPVFGGNNLEALIYYKDTGVLATSTLLVFNDTGTDMQQTPDGGNINVTVNVGGIWRMVA